MPISDRQVAACMTGENTEIALRAFSGLHPDWRYGFGYAVGIFSPALGSCRLSLVSSHRLSLRLEGWALLKRLASVRPISFDQ